MNSQLVIYDKDAYLSMALSLFFKNITVFYASTLRDVEKHINQNCQLLLIVEHDFDELKIKKIKTFQHQYLQLKSLYLSNCPKKIGQWYYHVDKKLSDWSIGDKRLMLLIEELTQAHCLLP